VVDHQRLWPRRDLPDHRLQVAEIEQGQHRSEDLLLHHEAVPARGLDDHRRDEPAVLVDGLAAVDDPAAVVVSEQLLDAVDVEAVDDLAVVAVLLQVLRALVELLQFTQESGPEGLPDGLVDVDVVDADAGLPAVEELAEQDAVHCWVHLGRLVHNHRALPPQLQDAGDQILRSLHGHQSARRRRTGKADDVHWQTRHRLGHLHSALNHPEVF
jgi:hypothetical protein